MSQTRTVKLQVDAEEALKRLEAVEKELSQISKTSKETAKGTTLVSKGFRGIGLAWKAIGIGAVISALQFLADKLSANQEVLDTVATASAVFGDVLNRLAKPIIEVIKGLGLLGQAVTKVFKGEFQEASDLAVTAFDNVKTSVTGSSTSLKDFVETSKQAAQETLQFAKNLIAMQKEVKLAEADQRQLQLIYQRDAELQRQIRDDVNLTIEERIAANERLGRILDEQFEAERSLVLKKIKVAEIELSRNKDNIDLQVALKNAKTDLFELEERITGQRSEQLVNLTALENEYKESVKETGIQLKANVDTTVETNDEIIRIQDKRIENLIENDNEERELRAQQIEAVKAMEIGAAQSILTSLGTLAGEGTKMAKATALSQILINTAQAISGAIKAGAGLTFPANLGAIATGVASVLSGIASAKAIFKKVPGGGNDVDTPQNVNTAVQEATGIGALTPNIEAIEQPELGGGQTTVQAFVVENDISNAQALQQELDVQATL